MRKSLGHIAAYLPVMALVLGGCDGLLSAGVDGNASVSFAARGPQSLLGGSGAPDNTMEIGSHTVVLSSVELRVSKIELEGEDELEAEMKGGTTIIALPVNGSVVTPITASVFAGTYDEFEMEVQTVRLRGTFDGAPFDATVSANSELEMDLVPPIVATENGTVNVTVSISFANWFRNFDGTAIDPRNLTEVLRARLVSNIRASFNAFEDHDRDGDRSGHGGPGRQ